MCTKLRRHFACAISCLIQKKERRDQVSIRRVRKEARKRFGKRELDAVLHDLAYDPPHYEVTLVDHCMGKLYFY